MYLEILVISPPSPSYVGIAVCMYRKNYFVFIPTHPRIEALLYSTNVPLWWVFALV